MKTNKEKQNTKTEPHNFSGQKSRHRPETAVTRGAKNPAERLGESGRGASWSVGAALNEDRTQSGRRDETLRLSLSAVIRQRCDRPCVLSAS